MKLRELHEFFEAFDDLGDVGDFEEPALRCAVCGRALEDPEDPDYYKPKREGWPKAGPLCPSCYGKASREERESEEYFYNFYYYNTLAPHRVREAEDFNEEDPDQTFMKGESTPALWHESLDDLGDVGDFEEPPNSIRARIVKCSNPGAWYKNSIGKIVTLNRGKQDAGSPNPDFDVYALARSGPTNKGVFAGDVVFLD